MKLCAIFILSIVFVNDAKDNELYKVSGADLIDLLRGFPTEQEALELERVRGDKLHLPDGIYFEPEDEGLNEGDKKHLYFKNKKTNNLDKKLVEPVPQRGHKPL